MKSELLIRDLRTLSEFDGFSEHDLRLLREAANRIENLEERANDDNREKTILYGRLSVFQQESNAHLKRYRDRIKELAPDSD